MRKLRVALVLLAGLWLAGEFAAAPLAESRVEQRVAERNGNAAGVEADIDSFPLVARLAATGRVRQVTITLDEVLRQGLRFAEVRFDLHGVEVDRAAIFRQDTRITAIERGTVTATIDAGAIGSVLGRAVTLAGQDVIVRAGELIVGPASVRLTSDVLPCEPEARVEGERVVVSCTIHEVPKALLEAAQG